MGQWLDDRGVDRQHGIEQMREADAQGLRHQPEQGPVAVKTPRLPLFCHFEPRLVRAVEQLIGHLTVRGFVGQFQGLRAKPLHANDHHEAIGENAAHCGVRLEVFERHCRPIPVQNPGWRT